MYVHRTTLCVYQTNRTDEQEMCGFHFSIFYFVCVCVSVCLKYADMYDM